MASIFGSSKSKASSSSSATNGVKVTTEGKGETVNTINDDDKGTERAAPSDAGHSGIDEDNKEQADNSQDESEEETENAIKL